MLSLHEKVFAEISNYIRENCNCDFVPTKKLYEIYNIGHRREFTEQKAGVEYPTEIYMEKLRREIINCLDWGGSHTCHVIARFIYFDDSGKGFELELSLFSSPFLDKDFNNCTYESIKLGYRLNGVYDCKFKENGEVDTFCIGDWYNDFYYDDKWKDILKIPRELLPQKKKQKKKEVKTIEKKNYLK